MKGIMIGAVKRLAGTAAFVVTASSLLPGAAVAAHAATHPAHSWPTTIGQALARWPGASPVRAGTAVHAGKYIFKDKSGHYDLLSVSVSVSALDRAGHASQRRMVQASYCTGCVYGVTANVSVSSFLWGNQWFNTYNGVKYGYYAWNIYATPGCSGAGSCQTPMTGIIGNYTGTVNPWDNQYVGYWGCCSGVSYLRAYVTKWNGVSGWATQNP